MSDILDLRGLKCPLPALKTRKAFAGLKQQETLKILCTDPLSVIDVPHTVSLLGGYVVSQTSEQGVFSFIIQK